MYDVFLEARAERDVRRLSASEFRRITAAIRRLGVNPRPARCRKIVGSESDWRIRVGEYRVIYEIDDPAAAVRVMRVRHRREAYR